MAGGSKLSVYAAIASNLTVMVAKFAGWFVTGSGALLSEAIHSLADTGNQTLLAIGMRSSQRAPDALHPYGYGREAFVWSLMSAVGIFFLGCGVTVTHGVQVLLHPETHVVDSGSNLGIYILFFSLVVEGGSLAVALWEARKVAHDRGVGFVQHIRTTDDPFGIAVLLEDSAAVLGVLMALAALYLSRVTHNPAWDAYGTLGIGLLLGFVALFLVSKNRDLLLGRAINPEDRDKLNALLEADPAIERVALNRAVVAGVDDYRISAEIDFDGEWIAERVLDGEDLAALAKSLTDEASMREFLKDYGEKVITQVGQEVNRIEGDIRREIPRAHNIALEPD